MHLDYLKKSKSETREYLQSFFQLVKTQFNKRMNCLRSGNGLKFDMKDFYGKMRTIYQRSCEEKPQQNGIVERKYRHILNVARALLFQANLPEIVWGDSIHMTIHLINRIPS